MNEARATCARILFLVDSKLERWLIVPAYCYFCLIILVEVGRRHLIGDTSQWGEMTARYAFVYLVYIAAAEAIRRRHHFSIDVVPRSLSNRKRLYLLLYLDLLHVLLAAFVIRFSIEAIEFQISLKMLMTGLDINMAWATAAIPLGWVLLSYRVIQRFVHTVLVYRHGGDLQLQTEAVDG